MTDDAQSTPSMEETILQLNEQLVAIGASSAEQSFGLAIWLGTLPILAVVALLLALRLINIILAFILVIILFLVLVAVTAVVASRARQNAINRAIQEKTLPQILAYQTAHFIEKDTLISKATEILPAEAPLLLAFQKIRNSAESDLGNESHQL
jgi:uncharacterized membrane protein